MSHNKVEGKRGISLFSDEQICDMRYLVLVEGKTHQYVATKYDITRPAVSFIINHKTYTNVICN